MNQTDFQIEDSVLVSCSGPNPVVVVPPGVEVIGEYAFQGKYALEKVVLPEGLREIRANAFAHSVSLREVVFPESLRVIEERAFSFCGALRDPALPDSVETIGSTAFWNCFGIRSINIPAALKHLATDAFFNCFSLHRLVIPVGISVLPPLEEETMSRLECLEAPGIPLSTLPSGLRHPAVLGLADWEDRGNTLPPDLEAEAMEYLSVEWPSFLREAAGNVSLLRLLFRRNLVTRDSLDVLLRESGGTENPEITAMIVEYARRFPEPDPNAREQELLRELETGFLSPGVFDASWTARPQEGGGLIITDYHGQDRDLEIPAGRGDEPVVALSKDLFRENRELTSVRIPEGIRELGDGVFARCPALRSVDLPSTMDRIPSWTFYDCGSLVQVRIPFVPRAIGDHAFHGCSCLTELETPEGVEIIGLRALSGTSLRSLNLPSTLKKLSGFAFSGCTSLASVRMAPGPEAIGEGAFLECSRLTDIAIPEGVKNIGARAFGNCTALSRVSLPDSLQTIQMDVFLGCERLEVDPASGEFRAEGPFLLSRDGTILRMAAPGLTGEVVLPDSVEEIDQRAFWKCRKIISVTIPGTVRTVGEYAFSGCRELESVRLCEGVQIISLSAFENCENLTAVDIPGSVLVMDGYAFQGCGKLSSVIFREGITVLDTRIFSGELRSITIPASVKFLSDEVFRLCWELEEVTFLGAPENISPDAFAHCDELSVIHVRTPKPEGEFLAFLEKMAANGCTIIRDERPKARSRIPTISFFEKRKKDPR